MKMMASPVEVQVVHLVEGTIHPSVISDHRDGCSLRLLTNPGRDGSYVSITYGVFIVTYPDGRNEARPSLEGFCEQPPAVALAKISWLAKVLAILTGRGNASEAVSTGNQYQPEPDSFSIQAEGCPDDLRARGLMVAVHNDYRLHGKNHTFWLFTDNDDRAYKGEGLTDADALNEVRARLGARKP
jgi:hypothetical protein